MAASARPEEPQRTRGVQCSDCRNVSRTSYYALNDRPICARCKPQYAERIARAKGPGAWARTVTLAVLAALGGAILTAIGISLIGPVRIICGVGVGYLVGSTIKHANGGWPGRKYQMLAVTLTYFALGLGMITPTLLSIRGAKRELQRAVADSIAAARARAEADSSAAENPNVEKAPLADLAAMADSMEAARSKPRIRKTAELQNAEKLAGAHFFSMIGGVLVLMLTLPILANLQYGLYATGFGLLAFGYGMKKAWDLTEGGVELQVSGPFKVGEGPIAASF